MLLCADLGGTIVKAGLVENRRIVRTAQIPSHGQNGLAALLPELETFLAGLCRAHGTTLQQCDGIALCMSGLIDSRSGKVLSAPRDKYADAKDVDLAAWAHDRFGLRLVLENDAHAACIGEWQCGAGTGCDDLIMVTLGTGIGVSVVMQGKLLRGKHRQAGVLGGHFVIDPNGEPCGCGGRGCVEAETSLRKLAALAKADPRFATSKLARVNKLDYAALFAAQGDPLADALVTRSLDLWGAHMVSLIHAFDPERIVLGGGIMASAETILPHLQQYVDRHAWTPWGRVSLVPAQHGSDASLLGLATLLSQQLSYL